jgi:hypothetical protein
VEEFSSRPVLPNFSSSLHYNKLRHRSRCGAESYPFTLGGDSDNNTSKTVLHLGGSTPNKEVEYKQVKKILLATAAASFMGISLLGAQSASATVTPSPSPTPTQQQFHQKQILRPEQFEIAIDRVDGRTFDTVRARGPVSLSDGNDTVTRNFLDVLDDRGVNAVNLFHDPLAALTIYPGTCSAAVVQQGNWTFNGGRGIYARETGRGTFTLTGLVSARERDYRSWGWNDQWNYSQNLNWNIHRQRVCPLVGLTAGQVLREVLRQRLGGSPHITFDQVSFNVQGVGVASQPRIVRDPCEHQYPSPSDSATLNAYHGTPDPRSTCDAVPTPVRIAA